MHGVSFLVGVRKFNAWIDRIIASNVATPGLLSRWSIKIASKDARALLADVISAGRNVMKVLWTTLDWAGQLVLMTRLTKQRKATTKSSKISISIKSSPLE